MGKLVLRVGYDSVRIGSSSELGTAGSTLETGNGQKTAECPMILVYHLGSTLGPLILETATCDTAAEWRSPKPKIQGEWVGADSRHS